MILYNVCQKLEKEICISVSNRCQIVKNHVGIDWGKQDSVLPFRNFEVFEDYSNCHSPLLPPPSAQKDKQAIHKQKSWKLLVKMSFVRIVETFGDTK